MSVPNISTFFHLDLVYISYNIEILQRLMSNSEKGVL
jgi:hypothetical protein